MERRESVRPDKSSVSMLLRVQKACDDESGSALLEMALCSMVVLVMILGIIEGSLALYADHFVSGAARDAVRYAVVRGSSWAGTACSSTSAPSCEASATDIAQYVKSTVPSGMTASTVSVTTLWTGLSASGLPCDNVQGNDSPGCVVTVTVTYPFTFMLPAPSAATIHLKSTSAMVISR
jgi:Flp pilus assembly protein TadG